ncbi:TerB family tellurite resistance protein [Maribacter polysiphoniae]|uniref:Putative tellurite resistance protein B-like protein n=1 Tax=Maribacter polysiphoniae TaxID=429344 RepID=A0A316DXM7_9FLAO|nr:TerB family tellurite resistance protein [Maribacter polysiphoniae]MBD1261489.1 TerB family tellurite resistance protein [Maribacter polysiphoniae]PWK22824.1 putative tellurite resistance protein B-like protein [Maribacter polysiphoniae]
MNNSSPSFTIAEKLAIVHAMDSVILADGTVHKGELDALGEMMPRIEFDSNFILQARNIAQEQAKLILRDMSEDKKLELVSILDEIAISDGFVHQKESDLLLEIYSFIGIEPK